MKINDIKRKIRKFIGLSTPKGNEIEKLYKGYRFGLHLLKKMKWESADRINVFYFIIDPNLPHPGLADRLKAIVSCYYICQQNNYLFKLIFDTPYSLSDYFSENEIKWSSTSEELEYSFKDTRLCIYTSYFGNKDRRKLKANKQYHCFTYSGQIVFDRNESLDTRVLFHSYFTKLFKPSEKLEAEFQKTGLKEKEYISIHVRFVNALGGFEHGCYPILPENDQIILIQKCKQAIKRLTEKNTLPVVVFSDSVRFLSEVKDLPVIVLDSTNIKHLNESESNDAFMKTFLDFLTISRSKEVYRLISKDLYKTEFSVYAAYAGGVEIKSIEV